MRIGSIRLFFVGAALLVLGSLAAARTGSNIVPASKAGRIIHVVTVYELTPQSCIDLGLVPTNLILVTTGGNTNGTSANDLILGSTGNENMKAGAGNDCLVAGAGDDKLDGQSGTNVCIDPVGTQDTKNCTVVP